MKKIGRYEICGLLGKGGMSTVYKARVPTIGKVVALKLLKPHPHLLEQLGMKALRERFTAEAVTMARLHHLHLVDVWDFDESDGQPFFVMEYFCNNLGLLIGETYRVENPSRPLPVPQVIHYGRQILEGLACMHQAEIIHRDIKPFNILLTEQDKVKISDFGMSRLRGEVWTGPPTLMVGSPYYAAPEQEKDPDAVDARSDLYAVGVLLYRMLNGQLPDNPPSPAGQAVPGLDPAWDSFFRMATAHRPADRFPNAINMWAALDELERHWQEQVRTACAAPTYVSALPLAMPPAVGSVPRQAPLKVPPKDARSTFDLDPLWRPCRFLTVDFAVLGNGTVKDRNTGLTWQQAGSDYPLTWQEAQDYVKQLNHRQFVGINAWRLPTVAELVTLVTATPISGISCLAPIFDPTQRRLWSADRSSFMAAWYVSTDLGFVDHHDFTCRSHVRAVCLMDVHASSEPELDD
jgi:serine/threonine protein kinase